jgi:hypothetical protein
MNQRDLTQCNCFIGNTGFVNRCNNPAEVWQILDNNRSCISRCREHAHPVTKDDRTRWNIRNVTYEEALVFQVMHS